MGTPHELRPLAEALAAAGVTARADLLPGFGDAGRPQLRRVRAEDWLEAAKAAWLELTRDATHRTLVGFSMGGALALALAADPEVRPDALVLLAPYWRMADRRAALLPVAHYVMPTFQPFGKLDFTNPETRLKFAEMAPEADLDDPAGATWLPGRHDRPHALVVSVATSRPARQPRQVSPADIPRSSCRALTTQRPCRGTHATYLERLALA